MPVTLTFERDTLWPALQSVNKVVDRKSTIPILGNILFRSRDGKIGIAATDIDLWAEATVPGDGLGFGEDVLETIPGAQLHDLVRRLPEGSQLTFAFSGTNVVIRSGKARFTLPTLPGADFPLTMADMSGECAFQAAPKEVARILDTTSFAQNTGNARAYLNGIFFHAVEGAGGEMVLRAVATDGHRLARDQVALPPYAEKMPGVILPAKFINEASRLLNQAKAGEMCEVEVAKTKVRVSLGDTTLISKLVDGTFPDYQRVTPRDASNVLIIEKKVLLDAIGRINAVTSETSRGLRLQMSEDHLTLSAQGGDGGDAADELPAEWQGPADFIIGCNSRYLVDILGAMQADTVTIRFDDPGAPILIEARADQPAQFILMPMRA